MSFRSTFFLKLLCVLCYLCGGGVANCRALDREAFSIPHYDLDVQVDSAQHRLGVRGKIRLHNDSPVPQKIAVLQVSSSLDWRSIKAGGQAVQFVTQPYASDIDHTGALSEAIVTLPEPVAPGGAVEVDIAYEGVITLDATRLTRIGTPDEIARNADWDVIDTNFTAVRGAGNIAWYPIATEVANLSEGNSLPDVLGRWKAREAGSAVHIKITALRADDEVPLRIVLNQCRCAEAAGATAQARDVIADCTFEPLGSAIPTFAIARYGVVDRSAITVFNLQNHAAAAAAYAAAAQEVESFVRDWFGVAQQKAITADLPEADDTPFESGSLLLTHLDESAAKSGLAAAHQLTHASFHSFRPWIDEGLAHFAQAVYVEQQRGRPAALDYMAAHRSGLLKMEDPVVPSDQQAARSLVNTANDALYRGKAMCVWWMLRDMIGDSALKKAIAAYRPAQDKEPSYMPHLIAALTQRELEWFFDDWVYRDRGLPDFKVESAYSRPTMTHSFMLTITVDNVGSAGAEVPIRVKFSGGEVVKRLEVRGKSKSTLRVETPATPHEVTINDGSVPESDTTNNGFKIGQPPG
ncbi:MAG TPA: hypothetical protein VFA67_15100 [Candidatus Sulfotelmatobacter sp.]|nr:hypothetical protein [Candidatus Sulfotelmatobacter sp.]